MPRSYWPPILAVVGLTLAAGAYAQSIRQAPSPQARPTQSQDTPATQPQPAIPPALQDGLNRIGAALEAANRKGESEQDKRDARENLEAQRSMSKAAEKTLWIIGTETFITFVGVLLVLATLYYTRKTLHAMVRHDRPYLLAQNFTHSGVPPIAKLYGGDFSPSVNGEIHNFGDRVAILHSINIGQAWGKMEDLSLPRLEPNEQQWFMHQAIAPGQSYKGIPVFFSVLMRHGTAKWIIEEGQSWFMYGYCRYTDPHGITRRAGFAFRYRYDPGDKIAAYEHDARFRPCGPAEYWYDEEEKPGKA